MREIMLIVLLMLLAPLCVAGLNHLESLKMREIYGTPRMRLNYGAVTSDDRSHFLFPPPEQSNSPYQTRQSVETAARQSLTTTADVDRT